MIEVFIEHAHFDSINYRSVIFWDLINNRIYDLFVTGIKDSWVSNQKKCTKMISWEE